jgi:hypothetical protein
MRREALNLELAGRLDELNCALDELTEQWLVSTAPAIRTI